jgi:hypothetical protein
MKSKAIYLCLFACGLYFCQETKSAESTDDWYPFTASGLVHEGSVVSVSEWLDKPSGKEGRPAIQGEQMVIAGRPVRFWGINNNFGDNAPPKETADARAPFYAKYGFNLVRMHKFFANAICSADSSTQLDPEGVDRFDYYTNRLRENGVYFSFSGVFHFSVRPGDRERIRWFDELFWIETNDDGTKRVRGGATSLIYWPGDVQDLYIEQLTNLLRHRNRYNGVTYAENPALAYVEMINEANIYWYSTSKDIQRSPSFKRHVCTLFCDWLRKKYDNHDALLAAWGEECLDCCPDVSFPEEHLDQNNIYPSAWINARNFSGRRLDTIAFLHETQNAFYGKFAEAIRATGYDGPLIGSNWIAGSGATHFYNLHSDAFVGIVDRHNYHRGQFDRHWQPVLGKLNNASMLSMPGGSLLSTGMQQVAGRPFMLSEWIHEFPNEWVIEGPAIISAYGMGLQGWDLSAIFSQTSGPGISPTMHTSKWDATKPSVICLLPTLSRQVYRGDVREARLLGALRVSPEQLAADTFDFKHSTYRQHDVKSYTSDRISCEALTVGRVAVDFVDKPQPSDQVDIAQYTRDGALVSTTGQLAWHTGDSKESGFITINTQGTKGAVGFLPNRELDLGQVQIHCKTPFAAIYLTALERDGDIGTSKQILVTAMARARNTGMKFNETGDELLDFGKAPVLMEPVVADITIRREGQPTVVLLDHEGCPTSKTLAIPNSVVSIDGKRDHTMYYLISY